MLATVTATTAPRPRNRDAQHCSCNGSSLIAGTVGGGIVESKVQEYAGKCSPAKESAYLHFSLDNDIEMKEEAVCGGTISILVDADPLETPAVFREMGKSLAQGIPGVLVTG